LPASPGGPCPSPGGPYGRLITRRPAVASRVVTMFSPGTARQPRRGRHRDPLRHYAARAALCWSGGRADHMARTAERGVRTAASPATGVPEHIDIALSLPRPGSDERLATFRSFRVHSGRLVTSQESPPEGRCSHVGGRRAWRLARRPTPAEPRRGTFTPRPPSTSEARRVASACLLRPAQKTLATTVARPRVAPTATSLERALWPT